MSFPSTLSGGQITQVRATTQDFEHYLLATPNNIVWQAEIDSIISGLVFAEFKWTNTLQGVRTDVIAGQLILITSAVDDFTAPIIRGRVRKVPDADDVFINEVATDIDNTMYVTVIDDFDIMEKLIRVNASGDQFKDWDLTWEDLPPIISGLQSVYADFSETDPVAFSFTPSAIAVASGAAISTWLWDIGDGSFTGGTSDSDQNIDCTFPGYGTNEHRWVHLTVTDDNGNATTIHFEVFTVSKDSSVASKIDTEGLQITGTLTEGWNATVTAYCGFANTVIWNQNRMTIASIDNYGGTPTPIVSNIMMVGRLRTENNPTSSDELAGIVSESQIQIEGFAAQLARIPSPRLPVFDEDSPDSWGEITDPTLTRLAVYVWAFHSTLLGLSSITFDNFNDYISDEFKIEDSTLLDVIGSDANSVNAQVVFAPSGEITIRRNNNYLSDADRNARDTIFDFQTQDITRYQLDIEYGQSIGQVIVGGLVYDTILDEISTSWIGRAPPQAFGTGYETSILNGQILIADSTEAEARAEMSQRSANHLAYINPKPRINVTLIDGFWWLIPTVHQWYTFTLAANTNTRSRAYTTDDRWLLVDVNYTPIWDDAEKEWVREVTASFELETTSTNAAIDVTIVPPLNDNLFAPPPNSPYMFFPEDPLVDYATDTPANFLGMGVESFANEPYPQSQNNDSEPGTEVFNIPLAVAKTISTTRDSVLGETYLVEIDGDGVVLDNSFNDSIDLTAASLPSSITVLQGTHVSGTGIVASGSNPRHCDVSYDIGFNASLTRIKTTLSGIGAPIATVDWYSELDTVETLEATNLKDNGGHTQNVTATADKVRVDAYREFSFNMEAIGATGTGGSRGDAFYRNYDTDLGASLYAGSNGVQVDSARPGGIPPYNSSHVYRFQLTGTGNPFEFRYVDSDYSDNDNNVLRVKIAGPNMGNTA